ncbi:MAG TPA: S-methyl-5'-thioadenosine phosphorylase [Polyangiaceae bacterium]|jgi:5'-methylthioadenosine phosphorylase
MTPPRRDVLAVIGGSGLYALDGLSDVEELHVETPYGPASDAVLRGRLGETTLLFLPRHGRDHHIAPHEIPYRANVCAVKKLGATHLLGVSAVGSLKEAIAPGDFVVVDQFLDLTKRRVASFFDGGLVAHVGFGDPTCRSLSTAVASAAARAIAADASGKAGRIHAGGTYVCIEGPSFSTRAESLLYRSWGASVIGMTAMPEAKLAREAELPYALLALATDYDSWHETEAPVSAEDIVAVMRKNVAFARLAVAELAGALPDAAESPAARALDGAIMTRIPRISTDAKARLDWLIAKYVSPRGEGGGKEMAGP